MSPPRGSTRRRARTARPRGLRTGGRRPPRSAGVRARPAERLPSRESSHGRARRRTRTCHPSGCPRPRSSMPAPSGSSRAARAAWSGSGCASCVGPRQRKAPADSRRRRTSGRRSARSRRRRHSRAGRRSRSARAPLRTAAPPSFPGGAGSPCTARISCGPHLPCDMSASGEYFTAPETGQRRSPGRLATAPLPATGDRAR